MEHYDFSADPAYIVTVYCSPSGVIDCYACASKQEVFQALTDIIRDEISSIDHDDLIGILEDTGDFDTPEEIETFLDMINSSTINNPEIIKQCFEDIFCDSEWELPFSVVDDKGKVWFSFRCSGIKE